MQTIQIYLCYKSIINRISNCFSHFKLQAHCLCTVMNMANHSLVHLQGIELKHLLLSTLYSGKNSLSQRQRLVNFTWMIRKQIVILSMDRQDEIFHRMIRIVKKLCKHLTDVFSFGNTLQLISCSEDFLSSINTEVLVFNSFVLTDN